MPWPLYRREEDSVFTGWESGWPPEPVRALWRREKSLTPTGNRAPDPPARIPIATPRMLLRLLAKVIYLIGGGGEIDRKVNLGVLLPPVGLLCHLQKAMNEYVSVVE